MIERDNQPNGMDIMDTTAPGVVVEPPVTVEECRLAGRQFGGLWQKVSRLVFEKVLLERLSALEETLARFDQNAEEAVAAFDQAAWSGWEAGRPAKKAERFAAGRSFAPWRPD